MGLFQKIEERYLLAPKILYLVINLQYYTLHQFRSVFARKKFSIENSEYGMFSGLIMFITFFTNIIIGGVSDKTRRPKGLLLAMTAITAAVFFLFFMPGLMGISSYCFWAVLLIYLVFNNPKQPLLDKIILDYLGKMSAGPKVYGKQRMWGTIAYTAATFLSEWCLLQGAETGKDGKVKMYNFDNLIFYSVITTAVAFVAIMLLVPGRQARVDEEAENKAEKPAAAAAPERNLLREYAMLLTNKEFFFFIMIIFSNAITRSAMSIYLSIFHEEVLKVRPYMLPGHWPGWLTSLVGLFNDKPIAMLTFFGTTFEILVMFISEPILEKLGYFWPLLIAQCCSLVRFFAYYAITPDNPHVYGLSCIFEFIKGIYFGLAHISSVQIAMRLAPPHLRASSQMIYQGTFNALGSLIGGCIFGRMFSSTLGDKDGSGKEAVFRQLFMINGFVAFLTILVYFYKYGVKDRVLFSREAEEAKLNAMQELADAQATAQEELSTKPVAVQ